MNTLTHTAPKPTFSLSSPRPNSLFSPSSSSSISFPFPFPSSPLPRVSYSRIRASSHDHPNSKTPQNPFLFHHSPIPKTPFLTSFKTTLAASVAAAALFLSGLHLFPKPSIALTTPPQETVETASKDSIFDEEKEKSLEESLVSNPGDVESLKSLMEIKIKSKKLSEAIEILNRLIEIDPEEVEWPMLRAHLYAYNEEFGLAKDGFNELIKKDPFRVEAYHGLVTVASQEESTEDLRSVEKRVEEAMKLCKEEGKKTDLRDFKLLLAQIRVLEGRYDEALGVYQDLVKEEPRDFRPYLCQGIIYTLLRKNNEAEKNFEKYRRLVPKGHPYARYFDDNMLATKIFAQKVENERAMATN